MSNPLMGFVADDHGPSKDEQYILDRSARKVKSQDTIDVDSTHAAGIRATNEKEKEGSAPQGPLVARSFKQTVLGLNSQHEGRSEHIMVDSSDDEVGDDDTEFGHYVEGCPMKTSKPAGEDGNNNGANKGENQHVNSNDQAVGPWTVVTKQRRQRKNTKPGEGNKDEATVTGSRFAILGNNKGEDTLEEDAATDTVISEAPIINEKLAPKATMQVRDDAFATRANSGVKRGYSSMQNLEKSQSTMGKSTRDNKLGTRGTASFKGKGDQVTKKSSENFVDRMAKTSTKAISVSNNKSTTKIGDQHVENALVISDNNNQLVYTNIVHSTLGRPPDLATTPLLLDHVTNTNSMEGEDFVDAIDQVNESTETMDASDMEVVGETPGLDQQQ
ncbi:hypothetical protein P8452_40942 [Trifolium repens]|nr:hypothetical protein P8452_40942 [Trifolium repens]